MKIEDEIVQLGDLSHSAMAMVDFVRALYPAGRFKHRSTAWIFEPNFVGFEIRYKRTQRLNLLVRSRPARAVVQKVLPLYQGPLTYDRAWFKSPRQLPTALSYLEASWRDWYRDIFRREPEL